MELLRRGIDEMNRVGISDVNLRLYYHPDVEYLPLRSATEGTYRGIAGVERFEIDQPAAWVGHFGTDHRLTRARIYLDPTEALKAVGLEE